ncbi:hypothetical protein PRZ48_010261 [Zasmidium cellare]|uniref:Uncharacterized protein n=1 Tax=Zasmidium cellare TaxID=395010 RepID=A0ABR0E937_ZASCE|nr:hypothetical protein PRZ48_010261 [Zasmidium cellare]
MVSPTSSRPVVLVLGAGPGIGASVAARFADAGYAVALAARSLATRKPNPFRLEIHADLSNTTAIADVFSVVENEFGVPPSVVVYNGELLDNFKSHENNVLTLLAASRTLAEPDDPLGTINTAEYTMDLTIGLHAAVAAAQAAVRGFKRLPESYSRTYIYSGNKLNVMSDPKAWTFGIARTGAAHLIWDCSLAYRAQGYKFYFTDERLEDGSPSRELMDPVERAAVYLRLCEADYQQPWHYTYVKGRGYVDFRGSDTPWAVTAPRE